MPRISIDPAHQQCVVNEDCVMVRIACSCDCGTPVNKDYEDLYNEKIDNKCENYRGMMCSMVCNYKITCDSGVCVKHEVIPTEHDIQEIELMINAPFH